MEALRYQEAGAWEWSTGHTADESRLKVGDQITALVIPESSLHSPSHLLHFPLEVPKAKRGTSPGQGHQEKGDNQPQALAGCW